MERQPDVIDLAPSPWRTHGLLMGVLGIAYVIFAIAAWPQGDHLGANLGRVVVLLYGISLALFALLTTALIAVFRRNGAPIITSYALALGILGALLLAILGRG